MTKLVGFLLFLLFAEDWGALYTSHLGAPLGWVHDLLLAPTPISVRPFDLIMLIVLLVASGKKDRRSGQIAPMRNALLLTFATTVLWFLYGLARGGTARFASWQTYSIFSTLLLAFTVAAAFRTAAEFCTLGKWLVAAAVYRATMCWISYFTWARDIVGGSGAYLTTHDDTIAWVGSIIVLIINAIDKRTTTVTLRNSTLILFLLGAIQFNSRRLAWVSLAMGVIVMYALIAPGIAKRRINRAVRRLAPVLLVYVAVGWGRPNRIFLPLRSLSSVSTDEDESTLARNAENLGLIATTNASSLSLGTGWGKPYTPFSTKYDISGFELWQYVPHNSILGLLAFTGMFGFAGFWLAIPTAVFFNSRVARLSDDPKARNVAIVVVAQMIVSVNQLYGDMGIFFLRPMYAIAIGYAAALRLPAVAGVWNASNAKTRPSLPIT